MSKKIIYINKEIRFVILKLLSYIPDSIYLRILYFIRMKKILHLNRPVTFNEKLQWLKVYDRNPKYTKLVDKYEAKKQVASMIGDEYIIPTLGVWDKFEDIEFDKLPKQFVLKCTHDSGGVFLCKDKTVFDYESAKEKLNRSMRKNFYWGTREWPYKDIKPRIIAEKYMCEDGVETLRDYKLMCFNGKVKCSFVCTNRESKTGLCVNFYDEEWKPMPFERHYPRNKVETKKPLNYSQMVNLAENLAKDLTFARIDFYEIDGNIYFGEITFYPGSGTEEFTPYEYDKLLGSWLVLPTDKVR